MDICAVHGVIGERNRQQGTHSSDFHEREYGIEPFHHQYFAGERRTEILRPAVRITSDADHQTTLRFRDLRCRDESSAEIRTYHHREIGDSQGSPWQDLFQFAEFLRVYTRVSSLQFKENDEIVIVELRMLPGQRHHRVLHHVQPETAPREQLGIVSSN